MQTTSKRFYHPELDVLRFVAFLLVFVHHASDAFRSPLIRALGLAAGTGLHIFFTLSAFLITELLLREKKKTGTVHIRAFFMRRVLRIWPLYLFFITLSYGLALAHHGDFNGAAYLSFLLACGNWYTYFHYFPSSIVGPLWSISIEEQFYLVWPFLFLWGSRRALRAAIPVLFAIAGGVLWYSGVHQLPRVKYWSNSFTEFEFFALGALLALVLHGRRFDVSRAVRVMLLSGSVVAYLLLAFVWPIHDGSGAVEPLRPLVNFAIINIESACLLLGFYDMSLPRSFAPAVYLGRISYGLYVYHAATLMIAGAIARSLRLPGSLAWGLIRSAGAFVLTTGLAMASYRYLEEPFLRLKKRFTFVQNRDEAVTLPVVSEGV